MSAAIAPALETVQRRISPRHSICVPLDVITLRSGVPESLPGRCTDLSEGGVGGMVAGELSIGQNVAVELRLPSVGVPVRARAVVRYQGKLRCGFEFVGLPVEQREMIRYWSYRLQNPHFQPRAEIEKEQRIDPEVYEAAATAEQPEKPPALRIKIRPRRFYSLLGAMLLMAGLGWWQWQRSWKELEVGAAAGKQADLPLAVSPETMQMRIVSKVDPVYPEDARQAGKQGLAVLDAVIDADGNVTQLRPVSGDGQLVQSAEDAVRSWKFEPYQSSGRTVPVETTVAVEFRMK
ncbi:MAG: TonB family protein [Terriglobales bacterium]